MNDRHPSEAALPTGSASDASYAHYPAYESYGQQHSPAGGAEYGDGDPLFGSLPGAYDTGAHATGGYDTGGYPGGTYDTGAYDMNTYGTGSYGAGDYGTGTYPTAGDGYATGTYDTGGYPTAQWDTGAYDPYAHTAYETPAQDPSGYDTHGTTVYGVGGYDTGNHPTTGYDTGSYAVGAYEAYGTTGAYETLGTQEPAGTYGTTGGYDALGQQATAVEETAAFDRAAFDTAAFEMANFETATFDTVGVGALHTDQPDTASYEATAIWSTTDQPLMAGIPAQPGPPPADSAAWDEHDDHDHTDATDEAPGQGAAAVAEAPTQAMPVTSPAPAPAGRRVTGPAAGKPVRGRGRRRPAKRSALLTVAVPSVAAMGVCGVAAASVAGLGGNDKDDTTTQATAPDPGGVQRAAANKKLDTQLAGLSAGADDFRDRASRTQERLDLKERQAQERKRKAEEAARKEALRPKYVLPVTQHGLSALFGQAGVNWMSVHTGIDFPVSYGTPVMSATDGTVRTQWNSAYGNMAIVTAPDGTETWYCHLSSTKIRSGSVKAGEQIAYSGNSGNSTGPHLHFEVRPGGGAAVDPIPWLRSHGLNPN